MHYADLDVSTRIVTELLQTFRNNINMLYKASEAIALLDMLTSLAACNITSGYGKFVLLYTLWALTY